MHRKASKKRGNGRLKNSGKSAASRDGLSKQPTEPKQVQPREVELDHDEDCKTVSPAKKPKKQKMDSMASNVEKGEVDHVIDIGEKLLGEVKTGNTAFAQSYFKAREGNRESKWSGKKISDIDVVDEQDLRTALSKVILKNEKELAALLDSYKAFYPKWHFQLRCGFGLIMYGFGSKKALLEDFASSTLTDGGVVVVNGYVSTINIKQVIFTVADIVWEEYTSCRSKFSMRDRPLMSQSIDELVGFLKTVEGNFHVYLIINNIEGPGLRYNDIQQILADVAASRHVMLVASIDHVNASLLWDKQMASTQFNWCWHHTPTYAPYAYESLHVPLILASCTTTRSLRSAIVVLQSLTPNAQSVFCTLAEYQLAHSEEGLSVHKLYTLCRERFLVSSELTLRAHLTEFKDHELVRSRKGLDGQDCLYIPLSSELLGKLIEDINVS